MIHRSVKPAYLGAELAWGTVGWLEDSGDSYFELGDGSGAGSETTLTMVNVTLFEGRDISQDIDQTRAQGTRILCQLGSIDFCVPPLGTPVIVANPRRSGKTPGNATILAAVDMRSQQVFGSSYQAGDRVLSALLGFATLVLQGSGTATLGVPQGNQSGGQPVSVVADQGGSVSANAQTVNLGNSPTDGVVLQTLLAAQLSKLSTAMSAILADLGALYAATVGGPPPSTTAIANFIASLSTPNYSSTVNAQK